MLVIDLLNACAAADENEPPLVEQHHADASAVW
jgi:hypothetical protein